MADKKQRASDEREKNCCDVGYESPRCRAASSDECRFGERLSGEKTWLLLSKRLESVKDTICVFENEFSDGVHFRIKECTCTAAIRAAIEVERKEKGKKE